MGVTKRLHETLGVFGVVSQPRKHTEKDNPSSLRPPFGFLEIAYRQESSVKSQWSSAWRSVVRRKKSEKEIAKDFELVNLGIFFFNPYNRSLLFFTNSEICILSLMVYKRGQKSVT